MEEEGVATGRHLFPKGGLQPMQLLCLQQVTAFLHGRRRLTQVPGPLQPGREWGMQVVATHTRAGVPALPFEGWVI